MLKQEEIQKILDKDQEKRRAINTIADDLASKIKGTIQKKVQPLKDKLNELLERKKELLRLPLTKAETLEMAKEALKENKRLYLNEFLMKHLSDCQTQNVDAPLSPGSMMAASGRDDYWKLAYWILREEDLEKAIEILPDIGLPFAEKDVQIKKIDKEIAAFESQIEKELKKL
jgi:hypothetical protein